VNEATVTDAEHSDLKEQLRHSQEQLNRLEQEREKLERAMLERDEYKKLYELVMLELERLRRHVFGRKAETVDPNQVQLALACVAPEIAKESPPSGATPSQAPGDAKPKKKITPHGRKPLPEHLPVERIEITPAQLGGEDAGDYVKIGEEISETIEWRSASFVRLQVVRGKYVLKGSGGLGETEIVIAPLPTKPIEKGLAGPGLLARVAVNKYCDHLPLHRQEGILAREGLDLSRSTLCDWVRQCHELCKHVVEAMWEDALRSDYVAVDATGVLVQAQEKCRRGHFWVLCSDNDHVLFRYSRRHNRQTVSELLGSYKGYIQADAATVYDFLFLEDGCTEVGCWSHARRRFFDALSTDKERALVALGFIRELYRIDKEMREMKSGKLKHRARERRKRAGPVLEKFFEWADATAFEVLPESPIGKAITYLRNQREALCRFLDDARLRLDNNRSERELRREAVGRKNWIFVGSDDGALWNATFVSLFASCQHMGIEPWAYLRDILCLLPNWPRSRALELSPKLWKQTSQQAETQQLLACNVFREATLAPR
jgi:transposase